MTDEHVLLDVIERTYDAATDVRNWPIAPAKPTNECCELSRTQTEIWRLT